MADISKITLLDGQEYDIKDAVARAAIPAAATATPQMDGSATVGTSTKYAKEDHVHPTDTSLISLELIGTELVDGDNLNTIKTPGNYYFTGSGTIKGAPTTSKFKMIVIKTGVSEFGTNIGTPCQILFSNEGSNSLYGTIYYRYHNNGNFWRDWQSIRNPSTVNSHTVLSDVPANAVFTDTTYTPASNAPLMDGTAAVGTSEKYAREDHVHPTDTSLISTGFTGTELVDGNNLAYIQTPGNYYFTGSGTIGGAPTTSKFKMVVIKTGKTEAGTDIGAPCQILFSYEGANSKIYYRYHRSGNLWRDWQSLTNILSNGSRTELPTSGANLNDYKTPGTYSFASNGSITNSPLPDSSYAFTLFVIEGNNTYGHGCSQVIFPIDATVGATFTADVYVRRYSPNASNDGWSDWVNLSSPTTINGHSVQSDVPANAVFTDTTYESKTAVSGGTDESLVTTGEKAIWNAHTITNKGSAFTSGLYKITTNSEGHVTGATAVAKSDITALGIPESDTTYTPASTAPGKIASASSTGTSTNYARQDHTHGIDLATGDSDGQIKIAGQNVSVKGLKSLAYADSVIMVNGHTVLSNVPANLAFNCLYYGECSTAAATVAKTVTLTNGDGFSLVEGAKICVRFEYANSASSPTLNVNDTGAKAIVRFGTTVIGTTAGGTGNWSNGGMVLFIYDGTSWVEHYWNNTTYSSMTVAEYTAGTATTGRLMTAARLKAAIKLHSAPEVYTATIPTTGWTTASYGAYIDVTFTGATFAADDTVFVDLNLSDDTDLQLINDSWACLLRATPTASSAIIRFKFREVPTVAIPVRAVVK